MSDLVIAGEAVQEHAQDHTSYDASHHLQQTLQYVHPCRTCRTNTTRPCRLEKTQTIKHRTEKLSLTCREGDSQTSRESCYGENIIKASSSHQEGGDSLKNNTQ